MGELDDCTPPGGINQKMSNQHTNQLMEGNIWCVGMMGQVGTANTTRKPGFGSILSGFAYIIENLDE